MQTKNEVKSLFLKHDSLKKTKKALYAREFKDKQFNLKLDDKKRGKKLNMNRTETSLVDDERGF